MLTSTVLFALVALAATPILLAYLLSLQSEMKRKRVRVPVRVPSVRAHFDHRR